MKATMELDDALYRRLKVEAALRGRTVRDIVTEGVLRVLGDPEPVPTQKEVHPAWFGMLSQYAANAHGKHDMGSIRESIAHARRDMQT